MGREAEKGEKMRETEGYYEKFVCDVLKTLGIEEKEGQFREICKLYGVDWKLQDARTEALKKRWRD